MSENQGQKPPEALSIQEKIKAFETKIPTHSKPPPEVPPKLPPRPAPKVPPRPAPRVMATHTTSSLVQKQGQEKGTSVDPKMSGSQGAVNILQDSSSEEEEEGPFEDAHSPEEMSEYKEHEKLTLNIEATEQADEQESDGYESPDSPEPIWSPPAINPPIPTSPPQSEQITPQTPEETFEGTVYQNVNPGGVQTVGPDNQCLSGVKDKVSIDRTLYQNWDPDDARTEDPGNVCQASAEGQTVTSQTVYQNVGSDGMQTEGLIEDNESQAGVKGQALRREMMNQNSDDSKTGGPDISIQCQAKAEESEEQIWDPEQVKNSQAFDTQSQPDQHDQWSSGSKEDQTPEDAPPPVPARTYVKPQLPPRVSKNLHPSSDSTNMGSDYVDPRSSAQREATKPVKSSDFPPSYTPQQNIPHSNPQNYPPSSSAQPNVSNPNVPNPDMMYGNPYTSMPFPSFPNMAPGQFSFPGGENEFAQQMMQLQYYYSLMEQNQKIQPQTSQNANNSNKGNETFASNLDESISKSSDQDTSLPTNNPNSDQKHPKKKKAKKEPKHHSKPQHEKDQSEATAKATEETAKDLFVCVNNINPETDEETFSNFLEGRAGGDAEVICVVYTEDKSTAVVEFSTPVDITEIQNKCKKKPLKGKYLEVGSVDPLRYIVVSAEGDDVSGDDLKKYFENKAQSDGGNVHRVSSKGDGCFTVKFKQEEDALRVCRKSCHVVSDTTLIVTPLFFPELGDNCNGIYDVSKHTVPLPSVLIIENVDVQIEDFLKQSNPVVEQLNLELKKKHAKVVCDEKTQVECLLDQKTPDVRELVKSWETEARESFFETVNEMIHKAEIEVMKEAWSEVQCSATKITEIHSSDHLLAVYEENTSKILFVGKKMIVHNVHTEISKQHREIEKKIQRKKQITSEEKSFPVPNIRLMKRSGIFEELEMISEDFKVEVDYQNGKIIFTGVKDDIMKATVQIFEHISDFENWIISVSEKLSKHQLELLAGEPAKSLVEEKFQENGLTVEIEFHDDAVKVYTINSNERSPAESIILNMTKESEIPLDETSRNVLSTREWRMEIEALCSEHENKVKVFPEGQTKILITTTRDLHDYVKQRLENFIRENSIFEDSVVIEDAGIMKFISKYCGTQVKEIEEKYRDYFVKLALEEKRIIMSGNKEGLSMAKPEIQAMIKKIRYEEKTYSQPGMSKILTQDKLPVTDIEDSCRSVIMFTGPRNAGASPGSDDVRPKQRFIPVPSHRMLREEELLRGSTLSMSPPPQVKTGPYICAENNIKIELIRGDLASEKGDVIVCSVAQDLHLNRGKSSKTLLDKGGQGLMAEIETKYPSGSQAGELATISGGSLGCQELYLGYLPDWKSSKGKVLTEFMRKCLEAANDSSYTTLVFPAMGTGQLGYPRDQVAEMMYQAVIDFDRKSAGPNLKHIKFICFPGDLETCQAFEAEEKHRLNPHLPKQQVRDSRKGPYITRNKVTISIEKAEISKFSADVLVVACDKSLVLTKSGKAAQSLYDAGGDFFQEGAKVKYPNGIANFGDFACIPGNGLKNCKDVYLTSIPESEQKSQTVLCKFVAECMEHANQSGYKSVAFAAMGTGGMKYPAAMVAKNMYSEVRKYSRGHPNCSVKNVHFVLYPKDKETIKAFEDCEKELLNERKYSSDAYKTPNQGIVVTVKTASITKLKDDVIVVTAKNDLDLGQTAVTKAIMKEGGDSIQTELRTNYPNGITTGNLAIVSSGKLDCKEIYIGTLPIYKEDANAAAKILKDMVVKCLTVANQKGHNSISFPCLGSGYNGYPHIEVAALMFEAVTEYDKSVSSTNVQKVNFVALSNDRKSMGAFESEEKKYIPKQAGLSVAQPSFLMTSRPEPVSVRSSVVLPRKSRSFPSVTLWVYGDRQDDIQDTFREISEIIQSKTTKHEIKDSLLSTFTPDELDQVYNVPEQCEIEMSFNKQSGKITMEGLKEEVAKAKDMINELLRKVQKERWLDEEAKLVADTVQWSVLTDDPIAVIQKLQDFPQRENMYIENAYKKNQNEVKLEDTGMVVDLTTMKIYPKNQQTQQENVVRKEKFKGNKIELPANWVPMKDGETIKVVTLDKASAEYQNLEKKFLDSVKNGIYNTGNAPNQANNPVGQFNKVKVNKIERIQNPSLYQQYAAKKAHIEQHVDQNKQTLEMELWHGAAPKAIVSINYYGFNRSYCGNTGGEPWYGRGVYFATDASYSARDWLSAPDGSHRKKMYQAKVITGYYCAGVKGMKYLPERITGINYDCAVNAMTNPNEFVIFNDTQAYPEYCIEFTIV